MSEIAFHPDGTAACVHTDDIDLRELGRICSTRVTNVEFNGADQIWEVRTAKNNVLVFKHPSRKACLDWEIKKIQGVLRDDNLLATLPEIVQAWNKTAPC